MKAHRYEYKGRSLTLKQWANECGINYPALTARLRKGWSLERAMKTPPNYINGGWIKGFRKIPSDRAIPVAQETT